MENKETSALTDTSLAAVSEARPAVFAQPAPSRLGKILRGLILYLKGGGKKIDPTPDPALAIINEIRDTEIRTLVKELHFLTPRTLKSMRDACTKCFIVPEDCPYVDYSIIDINKAVKRIKAKPAQAAAPEMVLDELAKVNTELAHHLRVNLGLIEEKI